MRSTIVLVLAFAFGLSYARAADCHRLVGERFNQALVVEADDIAAPVTIADMATPEGVELKTSFCRVRGVITPTVDSDINFEVWLPPAGSWNGKYEGIGNGGFAGAIVCRFLGYLNWSESVNRSRLERSRGGGGRMRVFVH